MTSRTRRYDVARRAVSTVGEDVLRVRTRLGLSQTDVARQAHVPRSAIWHIETRRDYDVRRGTLMRLLHWLDYIDVRLTPSLTTSPSSADVSDGGD